MNLTSLHIPMAADPEVALARRADALIAGVLCGAWLMAWWVGAQHMGGAAAWWLGLPLLLATAAVVVLRPGTLVSRLALSVGLMGMVGLHIHLGAGTPEYHFGVFVTLALLLMYRDWRPIVCAAVTIAVHHVVTDRLQAAGWGVYCLSRPDFGKVLQHAAYVVVQTAVEVRMAVMLQQDARLRTELSASLQDTLASLHGAVRSVMQSVDGVHSASHQIASGSADLSDRADETASQLRRATSLMTELTQAASDTAASAHNANALAASAAQVAQQGGEVVAGVVETMNQISTASSKIADIIGVIDGIAFQTNILALNAAVEAARAGEQGRGFAVVATEVRALAQRSADAAKEIKSLIGASVEQVEGGTKRVQEAGETMRAIVTSVLQVTEMIREMSEATQAQRQGLVQVNGAVSALEAVTQQNAALAEQSASSAQDLQAQADRLSQAVVDMGGTAVATQATV